MMRATLSAALCTALLGFGCTKHEEAQLPPPPVVRVAEAAAADVTVYREYPGTTATVQMIEINARVEGWVIKQNFTDGQMVKEGMVLYEIDPRPYEVDLERAVADLAVAEAEYKNAKQKVERNRPLVEVEAISAEQFDQMVANERSTKAQTEARRAVIDQAKLNLSYCKVLALGTGQVSKTQVYEGTLVGPSVNNRMTNIQALDPIWVEFYPIAADIPALRDLMAKGNADVAVSIPGSEWKTQGRVVFIDNHVDATTDTILARLEVKNTDLSVVPGAYVSVKLPVRTMQAAVTVPQDALVYQTAAALLWIVGEDNKVTSRVVQLGPPGGAGVVVTDGIKAGEKVIVAGQQKLRDGTTVQVDEKGPAK